jgi:hypothetical protein
MTTTTNPNPDVAPPPGAAFVDDWQPEQYRMVLGPKRDVAGEVAVWTSAVQRADGTIDTGGVCYPTGWKDVLGLVARMIAPCIPSATSWVNMIDASVNPAAASPSRYSCLDNAPAMQPT